MSSEPVVTSLGASPAYAPPPRSVVELESDDPAPPLADVDELHIESLAFDGLPAIDARAERERELELAAAEDADADVVELETIELPEVTGELAGAAAGA